MYNYSNTIFFYRIIIYKSTFFSYNNTEVYKYINLNTIVINCTWQNKLKLKLNTKIKEVVTEIKLKKTVSNSYFAKHVLKNNHKINFYINKDF